MATGAWVKALVLFPTALLLLHVVRTNDPSSQFNFEVFALVGGILALVLLYDVFIRAWGEKTGGGTPPAAEAHDDHGAPQGGHDAHDNHGSGHGGDDHGGHH